MRQLENAISNAVRTIEIPPVSLSATSLPAASTQAVMRESREVILQPRTESWCAFTHRPLVESNVALSATRKSESA